YAAVCLRPAARRYARTATATTGGEESRTRRRRRRRRAGQPRSAPSDRGSATTGPVPPTPPPAGRTPAAVRTTRRAPRPGRTRRSLSTAPCLPVRGQPFRVAPRRPPRLGGHPALIDPDQHGHAEERGLIRAHPVRAHTGEQVVPERHPLQVLPIRPLPIGLGHLLTAGHPLGDEHRPADPQPRLRVRLVYPVDDAPDREVEIAVQDLGEVSERHGYSPPPPTATGFSMSISLPWPISLTSTSSGASCAPPAGAHSTSAVPSYASGNPLRSYHRTRTSSFGA